jgi:prolyl oligopeptidase
MGTQDSDDPYLWLEEVDGAAALDWVRARNAESMARLAGTPDFERMRGQMLEILDSEAKIPHVVRRGDRYYNFWRDAAHPRGLWRRTSLAGFRAAEPEWEILLDLDALAETEGENWVWHGADCLEPAPGETAWRRCLVALSRGGADAHVVREFDLETLAFVPDGFALPEAKSRFGWKDADTIYVGTDFGPGSLTKSGYPRIVKQWRRGVKLAGAETVYEGQEDDLAVDAFHDAFPGFERDFVARRIDFYTSQLFLVGAGGELLLIDVPEHAEASTHGEWLLVTPRTEWTVGGHTYAGGALLAARLDDWMAGDRALSVLFEPSETTALSSYSGTRHHLVLQILDDVKSRVEILTPGDGGWARQVLQGLPEAATIAYVGTTPHEDDEILVLASGFLDPDTLYRGIAGESGFEALKQGPAFFDASGFAVEQHFAISADGTRVPYFVVAAKDLVRDGHAPTLLTGYGGFEVPLLPHYVPGEGRLWLERGGVYVVANIRGGGEYGPRWHQAALRDQRPRAYEDFAAVARDLVARGITAVPHLGIEGGSNGGLLVGNMLTQYPELFGAVVCAVPLLDMKRYTKLLAGASWVAEYGDPDKPEDWAFLQGFSPYHNLRDGVATPPVLFLTSTRDDRVHPGHARKMAAKMIAAGADVLSYENIEGGHGAAANNAQTAFNQALIHAFLREKLQG